MKTLILGLGSSILTDDTVGLFVVRELERQLGGREDVEFAENEEGGFSLLDEALGYDRLVVIDAIVTGGEPGTVTRFGLEDLERSIHACSPHGMNLATVMELGRRQGLAVPEETVIYAIEVRDVLTFGERPTPALEARVPEIARRIRGELFDGGDG